MLDGTFRVGTYPDRVAVEVAGVEFDCLEVYGYGFEASRQSGIRGASVVEVVLTPLSGIHGRVVTRAGDGVQGASVSVCDARPLASIEDPGLRGTRIGLDEGVTTKSLAGGWYFARSERRRVQGPTVTVRADAEDGVGVARAPLDAGLVLIQLRPCGELTGRVLTTTGRPFPERTEVVIASRDAMFTDVARVTRKGTFSRQLPPGEYYAWVTAQVDPKAAPRARQALGNRGDARQALVVAGLASEATFVIAGGCVSGNLRLCDPPLMHSWDLVVTDVGQAGDDGVRTEIHGETDREGEFSVLVADAGRYLLTLRPSASVLGTRGAFSSTTAMTLSRIVELSGQSVRVNGNVPCGVVKVIVTGAESAGHLVVESEASGWTLIAERGFRRDGPDMRIPVLYDVATFRIDDKPPRTLPIPESREVTLALGAGGQ